MSDITDFIGPRDNVPRGYIEAIHASRKTPNGYLRIIPGVPQIISEELYPDLYALFPSGVIVALPIRINSNYIIKT